MNGCQITPFSTISVLCQPIQKEDSFEELTAVSFLFVVAFLVYFTTIFYFDRLMMVNFLMKMEQIFLTGLML